MLLEKHKFKIQDIAKLEEIGILSPEKKFELINGEIIMMAPIGFKHAKVLERLQKTFYKILPDNYILWIQNPVKKDDENLLYPDLAIYPEDIYKKEELPLITDAILIVEISDTTLEYDKNVKLPIYAKANAKEVWIVNLKENLLEKYTNPSDGIFTDIHIFKKDDEINIFNSGFKLIDIL